MDKSLIWRSRWEAVGAAVAISLGAGKPTTSNLNFDTGQTNPNSVQVEVPTTGTDDGKITVMSTTALGDADAGEEARCWITTGSTVEVPFPSSDRSQASPTAASTPTSPVCGRSTSLPAHLRTTGWCASTRRQDVEQRTRCTELDSVPATNVREPVSRR